jgi:ABC-type dipeptide/oligopeptide/nickel transport system permease component
MTTYIVRRLLVSLPVIFGILISVFVITRLLPGDPCIALLGEKATEATCAVFNARYGFDQPIPMQFLIYLQQVLTGDLGESIRFGVPVTQLIIDRLPTTVELAAISLTIATFFGIKLGVRSATKRNSRTDVSTMIFANLGVSIPVFVLGLLRRAVGSKSRADHAPWDDRSMVRNALWL